MTPRPTSAIAVTRNVPSTVVLHVVASSKVQCIPAPVKPADTKAP